MPTQSYPFTQPIASILTAFTLWGCTLSPPRVPTADAPPSPTNANRTAQSYKITSVIRNLEHPWSMTWLPDGSMLITERPGRLRLVRNGVLEPEAIANSPEVFAQGQGGLMEVSVHPRFAENRLIYLTYSYGTADANRTRLARAVLDGMALRDLQVIFEVAPVKSGTQHFGSRIVWLPDGTLLLAIGDGGNPPLQLDGNLIRQQAQNLQSYLGKVVRLNEDGSTPTDNPFAQTGNGDAKIWSYGHRNIQGLTFDAATQRIWATEHGSRGGDEFNLLEAGKNYGWPLVTYSEEYSGGAISNERSRPGFVDAKLVWTPAIAPSGLMVYRGDCFPQWQGDAFAGGLVAQGIRRIDLDEAGTVIGQEEIAIGQRVRDVRQGPDGLIYVLTDRADGQLLRLNP